MTDDLPLIPNKDGAVCGDVRPVLREVFRELGALPLLPAQSSHRENVAETEDWEFPRVNKWAEKYASECDEIWKREMELKHKHAERISRETQPNIYKTFSPTNTAAEEPAWRRERGVITRKDLVPTIVQNACRDGSLWIRNILNRSSGQLTPKGVQGTKVHRPICLSSQLDYSHESLSLGDVVSGRPVAPSSPILPCPPQPAFILCMPPQLDFINFTVGQLYTQSVRLVNVSKLEVRLSIRPPERRELNVEVCSARGLTVPPGLAADIKVHFRGRDVRALRDAVKFRSSVGKSFAVPIACYIQPPLLHISMPSISCTAVSCSADDGNGYGDMSRTPNVLDLGARLLGDVHSATLLLHCDAAHASFFVLPEDAWISFCLEGVTTQGAAVCDGFSMWPAWWKGGGVVRGGASCLAPHPGSHTADFRILCSTAIVRPLHIIADSLNFRSDHITIVAQEKDYDICSEDDPQCQYFVRAGTAFPGRSLSTTVQLVNHSPITYSYCWRARPWGVCSCWEQDQDLEGSHASEHDEEILCPGAEKAKEMANAGMTGSSVAEDSRAVCMEDVQGQIAPRSSCVARVLVPNVQQALGVHRAVLMLILTNIPEESFPSDYDPMLVSTKTVGPETIAGIKGHPREVCEVVCCQLEVWWEVVPIRFVLNPCLLPLFHSRRVKSVEVAIRATQLFGCDPIDAEWRLPEGLPRIEPTKLMPSQSHTVMLHIPLPSLPNECLATDVFTLSDAGEEWESRCLVERRCATRHPSLRPARVWLGVVHPGDHLHTSIDLLNDTHQQICWGSEVFRWWGENEPGLACIGRPPCEACQDRVCSCALVKPARGTLQHGEAALLHYDVNAPERDGCVATLVQVKRADSSADGAQVVSGAECTAAGATLVAYRVLAPELVMRVSACGGGGYGCCDASASTVGCTLDQGALKSDRGTATLRPFGALILGRRTCYRLRFTNITPVSTSVRWDIPIESKEFLRVVFLPNHFDISGYGQVEIRVVLEARKVCSRRLFVYRAQVWKARAPLYLLVDTAVAGLEITCEIPIGDHVNTNSFVIMRRTQREDYPWETGMGRCSSPAELFAYEDSKRATLKVSEPATLARAWPCADCQMPFIPEEQYPYCLEFLNLPMRTDQWAGDVCDPGVVLQCTPSSGVLASQAYARIDVHVYADCWGLFHDQILIKITYLEPIVLDVWIEAVGPPLQFAIKPTDHYLEDNPILWMSASDPRRTLQVKNVSRTELNVQAYVFTKNEHFQDFKPFKLYLRFYDIPTRTCPCLDKDEEESAGENSSGYSSHTEEMGTWIEIYLAPDYGVQGETCFEVSPEVMVIPAGGWEVWQVALKPPSHHEIASPCNLVLRAVPTNRCGEHWYRPDTPAQIVSLRQTISEGLVTASCEEIRINLCALDLPCDDVMRVRKRFRVQNVGNGAMALNACTTAPWTVILNKENRHLCGIRCECLGEDDVEDKRCEVVPLYLEPRSSTEVCVEVRVDTKEWWPTGVDVTEPDQQIPYLEFQRTNTPLFFYDEDNVLLKISLILELEYPRLIVEPAAIDFGFVTDGDTRKTYFTVSNSGRTVTLDVITEFVGGVEFRVWPPLLHVPPNACERVYVQYTSVWSGSPAQGYVIVYVGNNYKDAAKWCRGAVLCRASPSRDHRFKVPIHDYTDDTNLLPPHLKN